jgi:VanZ family protein
VRWLLLRWGPVFVYATAIFVVSSIPGADMPAGAIWKIDKIVHFAVFVGLGALVYRALPRYWLAVAIASAYGALDELHQKLTPGRSPEIKDFIADVCGALLGALLALFVLRWWNRRTHGAHQGLQR